MKFQQKYGNWTNLINSYLNPDIIYMLKKLLKDERSKYTIFP